MLQRWDLNWDWLTRLCASRSKWHSMYLSWPTLTNNFRSDERTFFFPLLTTENNYNNLASNCRRLNWDDQLVDCTNGLCKYANIIFELQIHMYFHCNNWVQVEIWKIDIHTYICTCAERKTQHCTIFINFYIFLNQPKLSLFVGLSFRRRKNLQVFGSILCIRSITLIWLGRCGTTQQHDWIYSI